MKVHFFKISKEEEDLRIKAEILLEDIVSGEESIVRQNRALINEAIRRGLIPNTSLSEAVKSRQEKFSRYFAGRMLNHIRIMGLNIVYPFFYKELNYGLNKGVFTDEDVKNAQLEHNKKYVSLVPISTK